MQNCAYLEGINASAAAYDQAFYFIRKIPRTEEGYRRSDIRSDDMRIMELKTFDHFMDKSCHFPGGV